MGMRARKGIRDSDFVILICTPNFCQKANSGSGGLGYEKCIVTGELFSGVASAKKFVPILREGKPTESLPSYLRSKKFIDFRDDADFDQQLEELLRHIYQSPKYVRPSLGSKPSFSQRKNKSGSFSDFKKVFDFAYSEEGLDMNEEEAEEFAESWLSNYIIKNFSDFKEAFEYAYSEEGLDMDSGEALEFAFRRLKE
jgi:hypothetical protein